MIVKYNLVGIRYCRYIGAILRLRLSRITGVR